VLSVARQGSSVLAYLNRLSDLLWALARWQEGEHLLARSTGGTVSSLTANRSGDREER
jgi:cob(I)alamin adenosyltransferase